MFENTCIFKRTLPSIYVREKRTETQQWRWGERNHLTSIILIKKELREKDLTSDESNELFCGREVDPNIYQMNHLHSPEKGKTRQTLQNKTRDDLMHKASFFCIDS